MNVRNRTWEIVEVAKPGDTPSRIFDIAILSLIFLNVLAVVLGSIETIQARFQSLLDIFEIGSIIIFTLEYAARLWSCTSDPRFRGPVSGRIRFAAQAMSIVDLFAFLPFYLPFLPIDLRTLRVLRTLRILRVAKAGRYSASLSLIKQVFRTKKEELILAASFIGLLLVVAATVLYYCENSAQPDTFSSIPASMWWAVETLTTVGYGEMYPITLLGKLCASIIAILGVGVFAIPAGILAAGFLEALQDAKKPLSTCPHCGKELRR